MKTEKVGKRRKSKKVGNQKKQEIKKSRKSKEVGNQKMYEIQKVGNKKKQIKMQENRKKWKIRKK